MTQELQNKIEEIIRCNPQSDDQEMLSHVMHLLYETEIQYVHRECQRINDPVVEKVDQLMGEAAQNAMIKTGFYDLDRAIGGFGLGEFVVDYLFILCRDLLVRKSFYLCRQDY